MESVSLFTVITRGGILMIPILLCSLIVLAVAIERYLTFRRRTISLPQFMMRIRHPLSRGDVASAMTECSNSPGPVANVIKAGLDKAKHGRERVKEAMEAAGNTEIFHLEKNLSVLATLAGITPLIGFLGTVTGMIKAFMKIQQLSGNVNADVLAGGIWEAMVTTAAGLSVGIPAMLLYNYFVNRVRGFTFEIETASEDVLDMLGRHDEKPDSREKPPAQPEPPKNPEPPKSDPYGNNRFELAGDSFDPEDINNARDRRRS